MGVQYEVNLGNVRSVISQQQSLSIQVGMVNMSVLQAQTMLRLTMSAAVRSSIDAKLKKIRQDLEDESQSVRQMNRTLQEVVNIYNSTEQQALDAQKDLSMEAEEPKSWLGQVVDWVKDNWPGSDNIIDALKKIQKFLKGVGEILDSDKTSILSKIFGVLSGFFEIANSDPRELFGNIAGYVSNSFSILEKMTDLLKKGLDEAGAAILGAKGKLFKVLGSVTGFIEDFAGAIEKWTSTTGDPVGNFAYGMEDFINGIGSLIGLATGPAGKILASSIAAAVAAGVRSMIIEGADGNLSAEDWSKIGVNASVSGLNTMVDESSFGLLSTENLLGKDDEEVAQDALTMASNMGNNAAAYIQKDPERLEQYNQADSWEQNRMIVEAIYQGNKEKNRTWQLDRGVEENGGLMGLIESRIPTMSSMESNFSAGGGGGGGGGSAGGR